MRKICIVCTSRSSWGRLKSVVDAIHRHPKLELKLVLGASFYNAEVNYPIESRIQALINSDDHEGMALTTGIFLAKISGELARIKPDIVLVHGDRYEVLAVAQAAAYMNIPLAHTEGGEVTGCIDDKVRNAITALADIHFPVTKLAECNIADLICKDKTIDKIDNLVNYFENHKIFRVGSPAIDIVKQSDLTNNRKEPYVLVLHHPNTTEKEDITPLIEALAGIDIHKVWVNPNVDAGNKAMLRMIHKQNVEFVKDLPPEEYYRLLANCECAVGNSSSFIKEGAYLGVPVVMIGNRQQYREHACNVNYVSNSKDNILELIKYYLKVVKEHLGVSTYFGDGTAGEKISDILAEVEL